ncbi:hypothetical protein [uncultured Thiodictyon sp.]|uniref:hypothetical protein n=1 Tax=uncultured Thiodictyon sp. TaxID=1846217 RepID=UPI0025DD94D3|nr:hypothetical protein [uncultured Thiodictyon sp.]
MKHVILFAFLIAAPAIAGPGNQNTDEPRPHSEQRVIGKERTPVEKCIADCAATQVICTGQCQGNGQCFANCMKERDYCVSECSSR